MPTFGQIRAFDGLGPALQALLWFVPTALFGRFRDSEPRSTDAAAFHDVLTQAGFELLEEKQTFLADIGLMARIRRSR